MHKSNWNYKQPKRSNRNRYGRPSAMSGIVESAMKRHGFAKQVAASMIVQKLREELPLLIENHVLPDVKIVSYRSGNVTVACKHAGAVDVMVTRRMEIKNIVETNFPSVTVQNVYCNIRPQDFEDMI